MTKKKTFRKTLSITIVTMGVVWFAATTQSTQAAPLKDYFSVDTSANYVSEDSYGSGGSFDISGGTLNLRPGSGNTHSVVHTASDLGVGETFSVDVLDMSEDRMLMLTTSLGQPNGTTSFGLRLALVAGRVIQLKSYSGGIKGVVKDTSIASTNAMPGKIWVDRTTATEFNFYYGPSYENRTFIITGTLLETEVSGSLHVGIQAFSEYYNRVFAFDNLKIQRPVSDGGFLGVKLVANETSGDLKWQTSADNSTWNDTDPLATGITFDVTSLYTDTPWFRVEAKLGTNAVAYSSPVRVILGGQGTMIIIH